MKVQIAHADGPCNAVRDSIRDHSVLQADEIVSDTIYEVRLSARLLEQWNQATVLLGSPAYTR